MRESRSKWSEGGRRNWEGLFGQIPCRRIGSKWRSVGGAHRRGGEDKDCRVCMKGVRWETRGVKGNVVAGGSGDEMVIGCCATTEVRGAGTEGKIP